MKRVRVRITLAATVIVAVAVAVAGWGLVRSVESSLESKLADQGKDQINLVSSQLEQGVAPDSVHLPATGVFVQVLDAHGIPIGPQAFTAPITPFVAGGTIAGGSGATTVEVQGPGVAGSATAFPLDVRYETVNVAGHQLTVVAASPLTEVKRSVSTLKQGLLVAYPLLVGLVALVAWFMVGRALRPVEAIRSEVEAISLSTIHRRVSEPGSGDEVDRLAHTMNAMLDRLEDSAARQRRFVSDASHELRSPIASMRAQLEVAQRSPDSADWPAVADSVLAEEARLETLVADLLALALADEAAPPPEAVVDIGAIVATETARPRAVPVELSRPDTTLTVSGDRGALSSLVAHGLDNAARHATSRVKVTLEAIDEDAVVLIDDDGDGIAADDRERVFERFTRLDEGRARDRGGAGLGLAVVRAIARRHGGDATMDASPVGGARLVVRLPRSQHPGA